MCKDKICSAVLLAAAVIGLAAYALLQNETITAAAALFYPLTAAAAFLLGLLTLGIASAQRTKALQKGYCCCGNLAVIGGIGSTLLSILLSAFASYTTTLARAAAALDFFFLALLLGGIWCFLFEYMSCHRTCICRYPDPCRGNAPCRDMEGYSQDSVRDSMED